MGKPTGSPVRFNTDQKLYFNCCVINTTMMNCLFSVSVKKQSFLINVAGCNITTHHYNSILWCTWGSRPVCNHWASSGWAGARSLPPTHCWRVQTAAWGLQRITMLHWCQTPSGLQWTIFTNTKLKEKAVISKNKEW